MVAEIHRALTDSKQESESTRAPDLSGKITDVGIEVDDDPPRYKEFVKWIELRVDECPLPVVSARILITLQCSSLQISGKGHQIRERYVDWQPKCIGANDDRTERLFGAQGHRELLASSVRVAQAVQTRGPRLRICQARATAQRKRVQAAESGGEGKNVFALSKRRKTLFLEARFQRKDRRMVCAESESLVRGWSVDTYVCSGSRGEEGIEMKLCER